MTLFFIYFLVFYFWKTERETYRAWAAEGHRERDGGRHKIWSWLQASSCQHRAWCRARTHEIQDHDLSQSRTFNWLSHPGAPDVDLFLGETDRQTECEQEMGREKGRHRIRSRLQALSCQHRARCRARTHELWDHDLSQSWMLNGLSHSGVPWFLI